MREVFIDTVKAIDVSLSDEELNRYFEGLLHDNVEVIDQPLGDVLVTYIPDGFIGNSKGRIAISATK